MALTVERRHPPAADSPMATLTRLPALRVLAQLPVPVLAVASDGAILFANEAFAAMLGHPPEDVLSLAFRDIFETATDGACSVSAIRECADTLVDLAHAEGSTIHAIMSRSALQRCDDQLALITFQDLTEHLWLGGR